MTSAKIGLYESLQNKLIFRSGFDGVRDCGSLTLTSTPFKVWRAIRLIVDTGLHYVGFSRDKALKYFSDYAWDDTDLAKKEVRQRDERVKNLAVNESL